MRYVVLLAASDEATPQPGTPEFDEDMAGFEAFDRIAGDAVVAGEALEDRSTCRTVRHTGGEVSITEGPFAESVEGLGGFFVLDVADLDAALDLARQIPAAAYGSVEVRPLVGWSTSDGAPADGTARWLATIHGPETDAEVPGTPAWEEGAAEHEAFAAEAHGALLAAAAVRPTATATTVRVRGGEVAITDGPYAEGVEVVGGFYVLAGPLDDVTALASAIPVADGGGVQLQRVMELDG